MNKIKNITDDANLVSLQGLGANSPLRGLVGTFLFKTAFKSLIGNGLKTWLNVFVLSISFVLIILLQGILKGWSNQAVDDTVKWEIADGQYWQSKYDPYDPFSLDSSAVEIPSAFQKEVSNNLIEPILISQGSIYPQGRMQGVLLKGIRPDQKLLKIPTEKLSVKTDEIPAILGVFMARQTKLKMNDLVTVRWKDKFGTFEAADIRVVGIFKSSIPTIDNGIIWIPLDRLQLMTMQENCANLLIKSPEIKSISVPGWDFKNVEKLTESTMLLVKTKSIGTSFLYVLFLLLAMLAIFDTQTLSIFRRQREIGTMVALGMTRKQVVWHFTLEGTLNAILAFGLGAIWGTPLLIYMSVKGISFNMDASEIGVPMADTMYATVTPGLVIGTMVFILIVTAVVSYLPARKIAKMNPTDAIRGKVK
ncbi:MAG: ABC transporter permease [Paludibacter sp.]|nr:ABC transporter permease [Paludibacter sp.]